MRYVMLALAVYGFIYLLSFAKYNWHKRNRMAATGATLIGIAAIVMSFFLFFS